MQHLDEGTIHAWLDRALPPESSVDIEQHIAQCRACAAMVAEARGMIAGASRIVSSLDVVRGGVIPKSATVAKQGGSIWRSLRLTPARAALAATLMIAVSTLLTVRHDGADKMVPASPDMAAPAPAAAPGVTTTPPPTTVADAPAVLPTQPGIGAGNSRAPDRRAAESNKASKTSVDATSRREVAEARRERTDTSVAAGLPKASTADKAVASVGPVAQRAVAAAPVAPPSATEVAPVDTLRRAFAKAVGDSARMAAPARDLAMRRGANGVQLRDVQVTGAVIPRIACYQLDVATKLDAVSATSSVAIPERFALDQLGGDTAQRVVRAVAADGRVDSVLVGSHWTQTAPNVLNVRFASDAKPQAFTVRLAAGAVAGTAGAVNEAAAERSRALMVTRINCRP